MLRSRIGLGLVLACLVFSLTACGGGGDESMTPPMPDSGGGDEPTTPPTPTTQTCLDGSTVSANQTCPTPTEEDVSRAFGAAQVVGLDRAASALPTFGSVSQSSNVQDGMTTDSVSIAYIPHGDTFHPIATIRTGDGAVLKSHEDPTRLDVELPSGQIIQVDPASDWEADLAQHYTPEDWRIAEEEVFKELVDQYGEAEGRTMFIQQYGSYPIGDDVPYTRESRPVTYGLFFHESEVYDLPIDSIATYLRHPKAGRTIHSLYAAGTLDDSIKGPNHHGAMSATGYTDYPSATAAGDDDHLSWGYWLYYTITPSALDLSLGAFADGIETPTSDIPVSGTASYFGFTSGTAIKGGVPTRDDLDEDAFSESKYFDFLGQVNLQADFATASVRGQVNNFQQEWVDEGEHDFLKNLTIDLGAASIVFGTFTGDARATAGLAGAAGKWGGQFFGTPDAGAAPPAAGGTWGVTQGMGADDWKMLGGFGAWKP